MGEIGDALKEVGDGLDATLDHLRGLAAGADQLSRANKMRFDGYDSQILDMRADIEAIKSRLNGSQTPPEPVPQPAPAPSPDPVPAPPPDGGGDTGGPVAPVEWPDMAGWEVIPYRGESGTVEFVGRERFILDGWDLPGALWFDGCNDFAVINSAIHDGRSRAGIYVNDSKGYIESTVVRECKNHGLELNGDSFVATRHMSIIDPGEDGIQHQRREDGDKSHSVHENVTILLEKDYRRPQIENCVDIKDGTARFYGGRMKCYTLNGDKKHEHIIAHKTADEVYCEGVHFIDGSANPGETKCFSNSWIDGRPLTYIDCLFEFTRLPGGKPNHWFSVNIGANNNRYGRDEALAGIGTVNSDGSYNRVNGLYVRGAQLVA